MGEHRAAVSSLLYQHSFMFSASVDKTIRIWDPASRCCLQVVEAHSAYIAAIVPVATYTWTQFWSFGGDQRVNFWKTEQVQHEEDSSGKVHDCHYLKRRLSQLESERDAAKQAEETALKESQRLSELLQAEREERCQMEQSLRDEIASKILESIEREEKLARVINELDECSLAKQELAQAERGLRSRLEKNEAESVKLLDELASLGKELKSTKAELQRLNEQHDLAINRLQHAELEQRHLQDELEQAKSSALTESQRASVLQELLNEQDSLKTSRLAFVTEVWELHKHISEAKAATKCRTRPAQNGQRTPRVERMSTAIENSEVSAQSTTARAYEKSAIIIKKFLTDDEKLHLGIPLAQFEGGHDTPKPLDWSGPSEESKGTLQSGRPESQLTVQSSIGLKTLQQDMTHPNLLTAGAAGQRAKQPAVAPHKVGSPIPSKSIRNLKC